MTTSNNVVPGGGSIRGGAVASVQATLDFDVSQLFELMESNNPEVAQEIKAVINENFNSLTDSWLVAGLFQYYLSSGSVRCAEILCGISREPHDKFLIDKMFEGIRSTSKDVKKQTLTFLGHVVAKQPSWLYKIAPNASNSLFKEITKLLRTETDVVVLMTGLLAVIMIIPTIPTYITPLIHEVFDVFGRIATWTHTTHNIPKEHLLHLQVGLYSLFHRLYAMYPCNFLSYLRQNFGAGEKKTVLFHTIMPMLEKVKMHPALVTATRESEMNPARWKSKEYHEVIAECSKISLDVYESSFPEEITPTFSRLNSVDRVSSTSELPMQNLALQPDTTSNSFNSNTLLTPHGEPSILKLPPSSLISQSVARTSELTSLATFIDDSAVTAPPTPMSVTSVTGTQAATPQLGIVNKVTTSPPETAMEATPENTPIKDRDKFYFKLPPTLPGSATAVQQLSFGNVQQPQPQHYQYHPLSHGKVHATNSSGSIISSTPGNSVPSSPLPAINNNATGGSEFPLMTSSGGGYALARRDSIFDSNAPLIRRDSALFQRLQKVHIEQSHLQQTGTNTLESAAGPPIPTSTRSDSIKRGSIPSPITIIHQSSTVGTGNGVHDSESSPAVSDFLDRPMGGGGPLTPMLGPSLPTSSFNSGQGFIDPDLSLITLDEESSGVDECQPSTCAEGGLHMADHKEIMAFAKRVSRLRFHSQCGPGTDLGNINYSLGPSPGTSPSSSSGFMQLRGRILKRSCSCPDIKKPIKEEDGDCEEHASHQSHEKSASSALSTQNEEPVHNDSVAAPQLQTELPYEHLFQQILPTVLSPPVESRTIPSPHLLLDLCLSKAAALHNSKGKVDELLMLRGQVELLHGQLLFERHRREAHALRNRRLAGKCRKMLMMEEQNNKMAREIHNLESEIVMLKKEVTNQRSMGLSRENDLKETVADMESKLEGSRRLVSELKEEKSQMEIKFVRLQERFLALEKESDQKKADLFSLENEIKHLQRYLGVNAELRMAYEASQKEILLLGELVRRAHESLDNPGETQKYLREEMEDLKHTCEEEIRGLRIMLENKMSQCEVASGMINDLEKKLEKREAIIMEQDKNYKEIALEHQAQMQAYEKKYESVKETNHKLELEILNLQHQLTLKNYVPRSGRGRIASSPSNGELSPTGNSNSDVDSAASAAGYQISPERNTCFFGSPQFDLPHDEMKNLQLVLDQQGSTSNSAAGTRRNSSAAILHPSSSNNLDLSSMNFSTGGSSNTNTTAFGYKENRTEGDGAYK